MQKIAQTTIPQRQGTNEEFGKELLHAGGLGLGLGAGATALYYLLARANREKQKAKIAPPGLTAISAGSPMLMPSEQPTEEKVSSLESTVGGGLIGALGGGAYGALTAPEDENGDGSFKSKLRGALRGAAGGGAVGLGLGAAYDPFTRGLGKLIPRELLPSVPNVLGKPKVDLVSPDSAHAAWRKVLGLGALGAGALGGRALVNQSFKEKSDQENEDTVDKARKEYFAALSGEDEKAAALLDQTFERLEKQANDGQRHLLLGENENVIPTGLYTGMLLAALGSAGIGGTYMYDRTKKLSDAENLRRALESRARMRGTPATWVDPDELAALKAPATPAPKAPKRLGYNPSSHG